MHAPIAASVLRRKIAAHARPAPRGPRSAAAGRCAGWTGRCAMRPAPFDGLGPVDLNGRSGDAETLEGAVAVLPARGPCRRLEEEGGSRGLIVAVAGPGGCAGRGGRPRDGSNRPSLPNSPVTAHRRGAACATSSIFALSAFARGDLRRTPARQAGPRGWSYWQRILRLAARSACCCPRQRTCR